MRAGMLNRLVTIQKQGPARDDYGQPGADELNWVQVAQVWANIAAKSGLETASADSPASSARYSIRIRYRPGLDSAMRVIYRGVVYEILAILHDEMGRQHTDLVCEARGEYV